MSELEIIQKLMKACDSMMQEITQQKATNWGLVNDALVAGERYVAEKKREMEA